MNRSAKGLLTVTATLDGLVWQITDDLPNSLNFLPAKLSRYTVDYTIYGPLITICLLLLLLRYHKKSIIKMMMIMHPITPTIQPATTPPTPEAESPTTTSTFNNR